MPSTTTFNPYSGSLLTTGSFIELHRRNSQLITATGAAKLRVTDQLASYDAILAQLSLRVNAAKGYEETPEVARLDSERDATQKFAYWVIMYASDLPRTSALYAAGNELRVVAKPYKSIAHHELTRQSTETAGFIRDLRLHPEALTTLNLTGVLGELENINNQLAIQIGLREITLGERVTALGSTPTNELRKRVTALLDEMALRINASAVYLNDDATIPKLISDLNGVANHYRLIASQHTSNAGADTGNSGNSGANGQNGSNGTTEPGSQGGSTGGDNGGSSQGGSTGGDNGGSTGGDNGGSTGGDNGGSSGGDDNGGGGGSDWGNGSDE